MERNSIIPWRYSRWQGTLNGLFFIGFGIALYFKNGQVFHFSQAIFLTFGIGAIIYAWTVLFDKRRRKRGYYENINPPLWTDLFFMAGQILFFSGMIIGQIVKGDAIGYFIGISLALFVAYSASSFIEGNKKTKAEIWRELGYYIIGGAILAIIVTALLWGFYILDNSKYEYLNLIFVPILFLAFTLITLRLKSKRLKQNP